MKKNKKHINRICLVYISVYIIYIYILLRSVTNYNETKKYSTKHLYTVSKEVENRRRIQLNDWCSETTIHETVGSNHNNYFINIF